MDKRVVNKLGFTPDHGWWLVMQTAEVNRMMKEGLTGKLELASTRLEVLNSNQVKISRELQRVSVQYSRPCFPTQFQDYGGEIILKKRMFEKLVKALDEKILPKAQDLEDILNLNLKLVPDTDSDSESDDDDDDAFKNKSKRKRIIASDSDNGSTPPPPKKIFSYEDDDDEDYKNII
jgi:hypothetical protein